MPYVPSRPVPKAEQGTPALKSMPDPFSQSTQNVILVLLVKILLVGSKIGQSSRRNLLTGKFYRILHCLGFRR